MPREYWNAPEVEKLAKEQVIPQWHAELAQFSIAYLFTGEMRSKGKSTLAKIKKVTGVEFALTDVDLVVIVSKPEWDMSTPRRIPILDHEFCHVTTDATHPDQLVIVEHDIEEFGAVVRRHGVWREDVRDFARQLELWEDKTIDQEVSGVIQAMDDLKKSVPEDGKPKAAQPIEWHDVPKLKVVGN